MQLDGANLLIAAQQTARPAPQAQSNAKAFSTALASESVKHDLFAPLDTKQIASAPPPRPAPAKNAPLRSGIQLDIRV